MAAYHSAKGMAFDLPTAAAGRCPAVSASALLGDKNCLSTLKTAERKKGASDRSDTRYGILTEFTAV